MLISKLSIQFLLISPFFPLHFLPDQGGHGYNKCPLKFTKMAMINLTLKKENKQLKNQITSLNLFIRKLEEKIEASNQIIKIQEDKLQYFDSLKQNSNWFIKNCIRNLAISKNHRRYSEKMYNFCYSLHITSPKAYKLLKQVIPLPSKSTLYAKFSEPIREIKESLTTLNISQRLSYVDVNYFTNNIPVALSIDATVASPQPFSNVKIKNLFLLQIQPLCYEYKNIPFTLLTSENGQMNENIKLQIDDIVPQLSSHFKIVLNAPMETKEQIFGIHKNSMKYPNI